NFNGTNLLDGGAAGGPTTFTFQVGADGNSQSQIAVNLGGANLVGIATSLGNGSVSTGFTDSTLADFTGAVDIKSTTGSGTTAVSTSVSVAFGTTAPTSYQSAADTLNNSGAFAAKFTATVAKDANGVATGVIINAKDGGTVTSTKLSN